LPIKAAPFVLTARIALRIKMKRSSLKPKLSTDIVQLKRFMPLVSLALTFPEVVAQLLRQLSTRLNLLAVYLSPARHVPAN
jgi:hypothetical protein